jgi:hypothetical protein
MPKHIQEEHVNRMFPFEFYEELSEHLNAFTLLNPAFFLRNKLDTTPDQRKVLFKQSRSNKQMVVLNQNNLIQVEPFGELLTLEMCCAAQDQDVILKEPEKRSQLPISIIVAQLYDSAGAPVFASDVEEGSIEHIPEVLWDDPNLLLGVVSFTEEEPRVAVINIPERIEKRLFESVQDEN